MDQKREQRLPQLWTATKATGKMTAFGIGLIGVSGVPDDLATWVRWLAWLDLEWVRFFCVIIGLPVVALWVYPRWLDRRRPPPQVKRDEDIFRDMEHELYRLSQLTSNSHHYWEVRVVGGLLRELGVTTPSEDEIGNEDGPWKPFLQQVGVYASLGRLEKAQAMGEADE